MLSIIRDLQDDLRIINYQPAVIAVHKSGRILYRWLAALTPGVIEIHRQFQHESAPY